MAKKKKRARYHEDQSSSEAEFLRSLGLRPLKNDDAYYRKYEQLFRKAGTTFEPKDDDLNTPDHCDQYFLTEDLARHTLSGDFGRLLKILKNLKDNPGFPTNPNRITELGGGCGVIAMWLATQYPECEFLVYDASTNSLNIGALWSQNLGLRNIQFCHSTYEGLAKSPPTHENDLVLIAYGFDTNIQPKDDVFLYHEGTANGETVGSNFAAVAAAIGNLSDEAEGIGLFIGPCSEWGYVCLFEEMKKNGFGVDWVGTYVKGSKDAGQIQIEDSYILFRKNVPRITESPVENACAMMTLVEYYGRRVELGRGELESYSQLFTDGVELLRFQFDWTTGGSEQVRVLKKAGMILLIHTSTLGHRSGFLHSAATAMEMLNTALAMHQNLENASNATLKEESVHPEVTKLFEFYQHKGVVG